MEFCAHEEYSPVMELQVHLENQQIVVFDADANFIAAQLKLDSNRTILIAFFEYNSQHFDSRYLLYQEFPEHYVYHSRGKVWKPRKKCSFGRMYHCNLTAGEKYYLRLLLTVIRSPQSFEHFCTISNVVYPTYREACVALRLTESNQEWIDTFTEAIVFTSGESLRRLLVTALTQKSLAGAPAL